LETPLSRHPPQFTRSRNSSFSFVVFIHYRLIPSRNYRLVRSTTTALLPSTNVPSFTHVSTPRPSTPCGHFFFSLISGDGSTGGREMTLSAGWIELFPFLLAVNYIVIAVLFLSQFPCILLSCDRVKGVFFFLFFGGGDRLVCLTNFLFHCIFCSPLFSYLFFLRIKRASSLRVYWGGLLVSLYYHCIGSSGVWFGFYLER